MLAISPSTRTVIRDEEWLVLRVDPFTDGGWLLTCDGVSELVRGREALFLTNLEDNIEVLDAAAMKLVGDDIRVDTSTVSLQFVGGPCEPR